MSGHEDQIAQVDRDLAEIGAQVDIGELDAPTAERLRTVYEREREALIAAAAASGDPSTARSPRRAVIGAAFLGVGVVVVAVLAVLSLQDDTVAQEATDGVVTDVLEGSSEVDLSSVGTEELEAVIAANPSIVGMRLALARRYVEAGDHSSALKHYLIVLDQSPDQPEALAMIGWLSYLAGESELAEPFVVKALASEPDYPLALWFLANIELANGNPDGAATAIERLLSYDLSPESRVEAERFLAEVQP